MKAAITRRSLLVCSIGRVVFNRRAVARETQQTSHSFVLADRLTLALHKHVCAESRPLFTLYASRLAMMPLTLMLHAVMHQRSESECRSEREPLLDVRLGEKIKRPSTVISTLTSTNCLFSGVVTQVGQDDFDHRYRWIRKVRGGGAILNVI